MELGGPQGGGMMKWTFLPLLILFAACFASSSTFILSGIPGESPYVEFVFMHPIMDGNVSDLSTLSGTYELGGVFALSRELDATACMPFVAVSPEDGESESAIGNITVGISSSRQHWQEKGWTVAITMSLPTMADDSATYHAANIGMMTNYLRGFGKYSPKILTIEAIYSSVSRLENPDLTLGFEIGPALWITVDGGGTEVLLELDALACKELNDVNLSLELLGLCNLSGGSSSFDDWLNLAVVLGGRWVGSTVKPGVFFQVNLGTNLAQVVDGVLGLDVEIEL